MQFYGPVVFVEPLSDHSGLSPQALGRIHKPMPSPFPSMISARLWPRPAHRPSRPLDGGFACNDGDDSAFILPTWCQSPALINGLTSIDAGDGQACMSRGLSASVPSRTGTEECDLNPSSQRNQKVRDITRSGVFPPSPPPQGRPKVSVSPPQQKKSMIIRANCCSIHRRFV